MIRWLWTSRRLDARLARAALLPTSFLYRAAMAARNVGYDRGWLSIQQLPRPTVAVGNLTVGGSGKTPIASWIAGHYLQRGQRPAILLRGYGGDETLVHEREQPGAIVIADPDRIHGGMRALGEGATVFVLDDAFQRRDVARDLNVLVVSAETAKAVPWNLPAGPWREDPANARRASALIVTRKRADLTTASLVARRFSPLIKGPAAIVQLAVRRYERLVSGAPVAAGELEGRRVVAATGIADPEAFIAQTKMTGAEVQAATWRDHHQFTDEDVAWLARAARKADYLVMTEKDAVKLRDRWPASVPEPLVARLSLEWDEGEAAIVAALDRLLTAGPSL